MLQSIWQYLDWILGLSLTAAQLDAGRVSIRAFIVFLFAILLIRVGDERFMGRHTALDVMLGIVFGSVVSRGISGTAPFLPTRAASIVLVAMHWTISAIAFRSRRWGRLFKGNVHQLVEDGEIDWQTMRRTHISENDLREAVRQHGQKDDLAKVEMAYLERNGSISIIFNEKKGEERPLSKRPPE